MKIAPDVQIRGHRVLQDLLFDGHEALTRSQHGLARRFDREATTVAGIEHPFRDKAGRRRGGVGDEVAVRRSHERQGRTQLRHGLRDAFILDAQQEPVLFEQRGVHIGIGHRLPEALGLARAGGRDRNGHGHAEGERAARQSDEETTHAHPPKLVLSASSPDLL